MKLKPVDDRILVRPLKAEEKTQSGLILPETAKEKPQEGEVAAVGTDEEVQKLFQVGNRVVFSKFGGTEIKYENEEYLILSRSDVLAIIES
ncbi:MAG: co-chaperone GroES [Symbiobacteriia bacterium]